MILPWMILSFQALRAHRQCRFQCGEQPLRRHCPKYLRRSQDATFTMVGTHSKDMTAPVYQWQKNITNDSTSWADIPGANKTTLIQTLYQCRQRALTSTGLGFKTVQIPALRLPNLFAAACAYIYVDPYPDVGAQATKSACVGQPLQLLANFGDSYLWTGPTTASSRRLKILR